MVQAAVGAAADPKANHEVEAAGWKREREMLIRTITDMENVSRGAWSSCLLTRHAYNLSLPPPLSLNTHTHTHRHRHHLQDLKRVVAARPGGPHTVTHVLHTHSRTHITHTTVRGEACRHFKSLRAGTLVHTHTHTHTHTHMHTQDSVRADAAKLGANTHIYTIHIHTQSCRRYSTHTHAHTHRAHT